MNMDITQLWKEYVKKSGYINSTEEAKDFISQEFNFSIEELKELQQVCANFTVDYFDLKKLRGKKLEQYNQMQGFLMTVFFFGMSVAQDEYWDWPPKKEL